MLMKRLLTFPSTAFVQSWKSEDTLTLPLSSDIGRDQWPLFCRRHDARAVLRLPGDD